MPQLTGAERKLLARHDTENVEANRRYAEGRYYWNEKLTDFRRDPVWLSDNRRLLFRHQGKLYLIDSQSKKVRELLSVAPNEFGHGVTLSRDDRLIYFTLDVIEADIWLMSLE